MIQYNTKTGINFLINAYCFALVFDRWAAVMDSITQADNESLVNGHTNYIKTNANIVNDV